MHATTEVINEAEADERERNRLGFRDLSALFSEVDGAARPGR